MSERISEERLRNTRAWAAARPDMSGSSVIVGAIDELIEARETAERQRKAADDRMKLQTADEILREAADLAEKGYSAEEEVGLIRGPIPPKRVTWEVWFAVRAITMGVGIHIERQRRRGF